MARDSKTNLMQQVVDARDAVDLKLVKEKIEVMKQAEQLKDED